MSAAAGPGGSVRSQLQLVWERTGSRPPELVDGVVPEGTEHLWAWWRDLHRRRTAGFSADPISYQELQAWALLSGAMPTPWEVGCIVAVDDVWIEKQREK